MFQQCINIQTKTLTESERGDDDKDEVQRRGGGEHAAEKNAQVDPQPLDAGLRSMCMVTRIAAALARMSCS